MDEIEYKLNTGNSVLVVNAIDKVINIIKSKFKPTERQRFVLDNEELIFLRDKCSSKDHLVSLTSCQGLLALVELGVLEIAHTMSTVVTLLPTAHNYSAIISTMAGLLILDLKARVVPGQTYKCQFRLKSPQHPFITVLEKNKGAEDEVYTQMLALCTHPDFIVSSNSLELLRSVFLWLTCNPQHDSGIRPWQMLLSLPKSPAQNSLLIACLSCQQISNPNLIDRAFSAYSAVTEAAIYQHNSELVAALLPMLARISNELLAHGRDPRACYSLMERCFAPERGAGPARGPAALCLALLAYNLSRSPALYLHPLFNLCQTIINKCEYSNISLNVFVALTLQWLHLPSYLTTSALTVASKLLDSHRNDSKEDTILHTSNLKANKTFQTFLHTDCRMYVVFKLLQDWERYRDSSDKLNSWLDSIGTVDGELRLELFPILVGVAMEDKFLSKEVVLKSLRLAVGLVSEYKEVSIQLLPILLYKIANDTTPSVKVECLRALPLLAKYKENVPAIVSYLNKLRSNNGAPTSFLIMLYTSLADAQTRCFPYLQEALGGAGPGELRGEGEVARAAAVRALCRSRPNTHGLALVSVLSSILNRCGDKAGCVATGFALEALGMLWRASAVAPPGAWTAIRNKLKHKSVQASICKLLGEVPALKVATPEYDKLMSEAAAKLWSCIANSDQTEVIATACDSLANFKLEDYTLKDIPEIYRRVVKLPASYCSTPIDAARKPEDVLDYIPCEVWPELFRLSGAAALCCVSRLAARLVGREVRALRSAAYQLESRSEPRHYRHLPPHSVVRGLGEALRRQTVSPTHEWSPESLEALLGALADPLARPLPPLELGFVPELVGRGGAWRGAGLRLAARQACVSPSGRALLDNFLRADDWPESDITLVFELLPVLCRCMPPNSLRPPIEHGLAWAWAREGEGARGGGEEGGIMARLLDGMRDALQCEKIHEANRTLLSQILEHYYSIIDVDHASWGSLVGACCSLEAARVERMSSAASWWSVTPGALRRGAALRGALAAPTPLAPPAPAAPAALLYLNDVVDAHAAHLTEQEYSLKVIADVLRTAKTDDAGTRDWCMQLLGRSQVAFKESEVLSSHLYYCSVVCLTVVTLGGRDALGGGEAPLTAALPSAAAALFARELWSPFTIQMLEWLCHTRDSIPDEAMAQCCQRTLLALRHTEPFTSHRIWIRLESHLGKDMDEE